MSKNGTVENVGGRRSKPYQESPVAGKKPRGRKPGKALGKKQVAGVKGDMRSERAEAEAGKAAISKSELRRSKLNEIAASAMAVADDRRADAPVSLATMQFGGNHYKGMGVEPVTYAVANKLGPCEFSAIKYVTRHDKKGGVTDVKKAMHYCAIILDMQYGIKSELKFSDDQTE